MNNPKITGWKQGTRIVVWIMRVGVVMMSDVLINPESCVVPEGTWEVAYENIKQYIKDCEIPMYIVSSNFTPDDGRYLFVLNADGFEFETEVEMPGLPLEKVRYMGEEGQNPFDFPRLYVDGGSWLWKFGLISKEWVLETLESRMDDRKEEIKSLESVIETIKNK